MISGAAAIPISLVLGVPEVVAGSLGMLVLAAAVWEQAGRYQERWYSFRTTAEALGHEKFLFLAHAGVYGGETEASHKVLAERVEAFVSQEHARWISPSEASDARGAESFFINYRRDDTSASAGRLSDALRREFPERQIVMDVDAPAPGSDFVEKVGRTVGSARAMLVLVGPQWFAADDRGEARITSPDDFVRIEIAAGLASPHTRVIPILFDDAELPARDELPRDLAALSGLETLRIRAAAWESDLERLFGALRQHAP